MLFVLGMSMAMAVGLAGALAACHMPHVWPVLGGRDSLHAYAFARADVANFWLSQALPVHRTSRLGMGVSDAFRGEAFPLRMRRTPSTAALRAFRTTIAHFVMSTMIRVLFRTPMLSILGMVVEIAISNVMPMSMAVSVAMPVTVIMMAVAVTMVVTMTVAVAMAMLMAVSVAMTVAMTVFLTVVEDHGATEESVCKGNRLPLGKMSPVWRVLIADVVSNFSLADIAFLFRGIAFLAAWEIVFLTLSGNSAAHAREKRPLNRLQFHRI